MDNLDKTTIIYLTPYQAKCWTMMQFLDSVGAFNVKLGRVIIDFDYAGQIGNVSITYNYKTPIDKEIENKLS